MNVLPGDTVFLVRIMGAKKTFTQSVVYSVSKKLRRIKLHGIDANFDSRGQLIGVPAWAPVMWIESITPALMTEIREQANYEE